MARTLSTAEAARALGVSEARLRTLVRSVARSGPTGPPRTGRRYAFTFQDVVLLRTAHELLQRRVPAARIARSLEALRKALPDDRSLSGLRIYADGREVAVRDGDQSWQPATGQVLFDFEADELASPAPDLAPAEALPAPADLPARRARNEFERALELEDDDPVAACSAYGRALELDPELVDAYVNLGCIAHEAGRAAEAVRLFRLALERAPDDALVHFDLALALEDLRGARDALPHYERAIELDPGFADAHFGAAEAFERMGHVRDAIRHYTAYKKLTQAE